MRRPPRRSSAAASLEIAALFLAALASLAHDLIRLLLNIPLVAFRHRAAVGEGQCLGFGLEGEGFLEAGFALFGGVRAFLQLGVALDRGLVVAVFEIIGDRAGGCRAILWRADDGSGRCTDCLGVTRRQLPGLANHQPGLQREQLHPHHAGHAQPRGGEIGDGNIARPRRLFGAGDHSGDDMAGGGVESGVAQHQCRAALGGCTVGEGKRHDDDVAGIKGHARLPRPPGWPIRRAWRTERR